MLHGAKQTLRPHRDQRTTQAKRRLLIVTKQRTAIGVTVAVLLFSAAGSLFVFQRQADAWWSSSWNYRRKITLNNTASSTNLTNFPIRVSLTSSNINYANTQNAGQDIRFVDSDDSTALSYEIERWDESGTSEVWVKVPQINANSNTDFIYMYYGNTSASDGQNASDVWSNSYTGVWHLHQTVNDDVAGLVDSVSGMTATPRNLQDGGGGATNFNSKIGKGVDLAGDDDWLELGSSTFGLVQGKSAVTVMGWSRLDDTSGIAALFNLNINSSCAGQSRVALQVDGGTGAQDNLHTQIRAPDSGSGTSSSDNDTADITTNTWYLMAGVVDVPNDNLQAYINGVQKASSTHSFTPTALDNTPSACGAMGADDDGASEWMNGSLDEIRISDGVRSADWIEAEYVTQNNAMNSFAAEESGPPAAPTLTDFGSNVSTTPTFQLRTTDSTSPVYVRYRIQICSTSNCSSVVRTIDQTASQTGWSGQDSQSNTAYVVSSVITSSTLAGHTYQTPALSSGTQYWWRGGAIDPGGSNTWSDWSAISTFTTQSVPAAPTLLEPANSATNIPERPVFRLYTTDADADNVQYKVEVCSTSNCSSVVRTIDQTASQTGWASQNASSGTRYSSGTTLAGSQQAVHIYETPQLQSNTQYWWRAYAIDPSGSNTFSSASSIQTFTTSDRTDNVRIRGSTIIQGGTRFGS